MFNPDVREDVVRPVMNDKFEVIQLNDNPARYVKIGFRHLFAISLYGMPNINPIVACHKLNIDLGGRYVS